jgi:PAS domain S-box-containing protein
MVASEKDRFNRSEDKSSELLHCGVKSDRWLADIVNFLPDPTFVIDKEGTVISWNRAIEDLTGIKAQDILGKGNYEYAIPFYGSRRPILVDLVLYPDANIEAEYESLQKDGLNLSCEVFKPSLGQKGSYIWAKAAPLYDSSGNIVGSMESLRDMTERKQMEEDLRRNREKYHNIFENSIMGIYESLPGGRYLSVNPAFAQLFGYDSPEELIASVTDIGHQLYANPEDRDRAVKTLLAQGFLERFELEVNRKDGTKFWVSMNTKIVRDENGTHFDGTVEDITDRKQAEEELRESHQILDGIINTIPVRVFWKDRDLVYLGCNAIFAHDAGFADSKDIVGKDDYQMGWRDQAELYRADDRQVIESGRPKLLIEEPQTTPDGNTIVLLTSKIPLRRSGGEIIGVLGTYMDITERKRGEEALRESEERFRAQYQSSPVPTFTWQKHGSDFVLVDFNDAAKALTDGKVSRFVGQRASDLYADRQEILHDLLRCHDEREVVRRETRSQNFVPGALVVATFAPVPPDLVLVHLEDITERKRMESELLRSRDEMELRVKERTEELARKNAEMERFIYTVSHDLRTPLISMSGFLSFLKADAEKGDIKRLDADLRIVSDAVTKMDRLLLDTLELSRIGHIVNSPENVPFREIVSEALAQSSAKLNSKNVKVTVEEDLPIVQVDRMRFVEVLVNLVENSVKYIGDQPQPEIEIGKRQDGENTVFFVRDNGIGIDPSQHDKVFELFYKVDKKSEGSGAGLAIVKKIIEVHRGRIWIESEAGKGCTVCFTIPHVKDVFDTLNKGNKNHCDMESEEP